MIFFFTPERPDRVTKRPDIRFTASLAVVTLVLDWGVASGQAVADSLPAAATVEVLPLNSSELSEVERTVAANGMGLAARVRWSWAWRDPSYAAAATISATSLGDDGSVYALALLQIEGLNGCAYSLREVSLPAELTPLGAGVEPLDPTNWGALVAASTADAEDVHSTNRFGWNITTGANDAGVKYSVAQDPRHPGLYYATWQLPGTNVLYLQQEGLVLGAGSGGRGAGATVEADLMGTELGPGVGGTYFFQFGEEGPVPLRNAFTLVALRFAFAVEGLYLPRTQAEKDAVESQVRGQWTPVPKVGQYTLEPVAVAISLVNSGTVELKALEPVAPGEELETHQFNALGGTAEKTAVRAATAEWSVQYAIPVSATNSLFSVFKKVPVQP